MTRRKPMKHKAWIKGTSVFLSFLGSFLIVGNAIATSSPDYKNMVDGIFGLNYGAGVSGDASNYVFTSDYKNSVELITKRSEVATQLEEEGLVLLKNSNNILPLRKSADQVLNVTVLGSRAFTFKENATRKDLRDGYTDKPPITDFRQMNVYAGICGSRTYGASVTLDSGKIDIPVTLLDALASENINVNPSCERVYAELPFPNPPMGSEANGQAGGPFSIGEPTVSKDNFSDLATYKDAAIVMIGRMSGEGREYLPGDRGIADKSDGSKSALNLSDSERNLISVAKSISDNVVVLLNSAIPMEIEELKDDDSISVLWIGLPGSYGMNAVARVLSGTSNPSGSLPDIYPVDSSASPAAVNFGADSQSGESFTWSNPGSAKEAYNGHYVVLAEGIYDGYYYYETRYADAVLGRGNATSSKGAGRNSSGSWKYEDEVSYSFGYGKSYTEFDLDVLENRFNPETLELEVDVKVTNTGDVAGKKSVQLYMSSPFTSYDVTNGVEKSAIQLVGFEKTKLLEAGEDETLTVSVPLKYIASYDQKVEHDSLVGGYILEDADYYFAVGNGAHEALNNILVRQDGANESKIYKDFDVPALSELAFSINPAKISELTGLDRGEFVSGVNATLLNKVSEDIYIANQIQSGDYNYYKPGSVTYLSRTDWDATFPVTYPGLEITADMELYLGKNRGNGGHVYQFQNGKVDTLWGVDHTVSDDEEEETEENTAVQEVIANYKNAIFEDERWDYLLEQITFKEALLFAPRGGSSCKSFVSVNAPEAWQADGPNGNLTKGLAEKASAVGPMGLAKDDVNASYKSCDMPCEPIIAGTFNKQLVEAEGDSFGEMALWDNCKIVWAPGMNLHRTPFNSRNHEYYSEDPMLTNIMGTAFVRGGLKKGAILSAKHFAFNTQETYREGLSQFLNEQAGRELELRGFQGLFEDVEVTNMVDAKVNALGLMSSFSRLGCTGVNAHTGLMVNILRQEWGFKGLISTDFVATGDFFNPQDCVANNVTFMACGNSDGYLSGIWSNYANKTKSDPFLNKALKQNMHHYMYAIANSSVLNGFDASTTAVDSSAIVSPWQIAFLVGGGVMLTSSVGLFVLYYFLKKKEQLKVEEVK